MVKEMVKLMISLWLSCMYSSAVVPPFPLLITGREVLGPWRQHQFCLFGNVYDRNWKRNLCLKEHTFSTWPCYLYLCVKFGKPARVCRGKKPVSVDKICPTSGSTQTHVHFILHHWADKLGLSHTFPTPPPSSTELYISFLKVNSIS